MEESDPKNCDADKENNKEMSEIREVTNMG